MESHPLWPLLSLTLRSYLYTLSLPLPTPQCRPLAAPTAVSPSQCACPGCPQDEASPRTRPPLSLLPHSKSAGPSLPPNVTPPDPQPYSYSSLAQKRWKTPEGPAESGHSQCPSTWRPLGPATVRSLDWGQLGGQYVGLVMGRYLLRMKRYPLGVGEDVGRLSFLLAPAEPRGPTGCWGNPQAISSIPRARGGSMYSCPVCQPQMFQ